MNVIKIKTDIEVTVHFEDDGSLVVEVYQGDDDTPLASEVVPLYSLVKEYYRFVKDPTTEKIGNKEAMEMAYNIIDEMQDCIDFLNDAIEDPDDSID